MSLKRTPFWIFSIKHQALEITFGIKKIPKKFNSGLQVTMKSLNAPKNVTAVSCELHYLVKSRSHFLPKNYKIVFLVIRSSNWTSAKSTKLVLFFRQDSSLWLQPPIRTYYFLVYAGLTSFRCGLELFKSVDFWLRYSKSGRFLKRSLEFNTVANFSKFTPCNKRLRSSVSAHLSGCD